MGSLLCRTIEEFIHAPAEAMGFLRKVALGLAHESKSAVWTTPCGLPVMSWYPEQDHTRITLFLHDRGYKVQHKVKIDTEAKDTVRKEKSANGIAPNFVHSMDACHLMMVVNAAASEDITQVALVHDSFGCLAADATRWNEIIREQFTRLYTEFDVLGEVREQALKDISAPNAHRIPEVPAKGTLDLNDIKRSLYAFA
jgi:DNA-directed RNA polymerase